MSKKPLLTDAEKRARRHSAKAAKLTAEAKADAGPLFADQVPETTQNDVYWHWRRVSANATEGLAEMGFLNDHPLEKFQEQRLRELASQHIGAERVAKLDEYRQRTYPSPGGGWVYGLSFWVKVLTTTQRVVLGMASGELLPSGFHRVIETDVWPPEGYVPPLTRADIDAYLAIPAPMPSGFENTAPAIPK